MKNTRADHHAERGGFQNPPGSPTRRASFADMAKFISGQIAYSLSEVIPDSHVLSQSEFSRQLSSASNPSVTWLGHSAFIIRLDGKVIITDPFLGERAGSLGIGPKRYVSAPISGADLPKADIMLISHNHYDHLDDATIRAYRYKTETQIIVPLGLGDFFVRRGYSKVSEQDWWDKWAIDGIEITTLPAVHFSGRGISDRNKTLWASFGISTGEGKIWFSGDTAKGEVFEEVGRRAGPFDLSLIAIGAYEPRSIMESVHVTPEEAIEVVQMVGARKAIGMHWGTIALTPENPFEAPIRFRNAARNQGFGEENAIAMRIGETRSLKADGLGSSPGG